MQLQERSAVEAVVENDRRYVRHWWSTQSAINPLPAAGAEGRRLRDYAGRR